MQREFEATLPIGYQDNNTGTIHQKAVLRKMTGHEESLLYNTSLSATQLVTELIRSCLVRLDNLSTITSEMVDQFYSADRNYLLLELRRITLGDRLQATYQCPRCNFMVALDEDLSQIEIKRVPNDQPLTDISIELEDGYIDKEGNEHKSVDLRLPRGIDEARVSLNADKDPVKLQDVLLLRCIQRFGKLHNDDLESYGVKILRDLTLGDRQRLQKALIQESPGVNFQRNIICGNCGTSFKGVLDVAGFFVLS